MRWIVSAATPVIGLDELAIKSREHSCSESCRGAIQRAGGR
jgi:hypothetical protein